MCDTIAITKDLSGDGAVWFAKNSDREPGEAQIVEHIPAKNYPEPASLQCTHIEIPQAPRTLEVLISRPFWMWGAEMGTNEKGVAIGNEAVFTKLPYDKTGLTGMDLLRLALERASSAREALDLITNLISLHGQGGGCGYRNRRFRYHNSFMVADSDEAWVLETAGRFWAAERVQGIRAISNALSIGNQFDLISLDAYPFARSQGWCRSSADFDFARCFGDRFYATMSGGQARSACALSAVGDGGPERARLFAALRDHAGSVPSSGWRMKMPCAHASWWPARRAGQTTGSMVSRLGAGGAAHWLTGTSSPCLSVFKPARLGGDLLSTGPQPGEGYDSESLFWRHERLHRLVLQDYADRKRIFEVSRGEIEAKFGPEGNALTPRDIQSSWDEHREAIADWTSRVEASMSRGRRRSFFSRYWEEQKSLDKIPASNR